MKDIKIEENLTAEEFLEVLEAVGFRTYSIGQANRALENTMYMVKVEVDGKLAGMGRVVGDGYISCMLTGICVKPEFQKMGIGLKIVQRLKQLVEEGVMPGERIQIELAPTAGNEAFYMKAGFKYKPEKVTGMYLWIEK